jgi:hypothetical protein
VQLWQRLQCCNFRGCGRCPIANSPLSHCVLRVIWCWLALRTPAAPPSRCPTPTKPMFTVCRRRRQRSCSRDLLCVRVFSHHGLRLCTAPMSWLPAPPHCLVLLLCQGTLLPWCSAAAAAAAAAGDCGAASSAAAAAGGFSSAASAAAASAAVRRHDDTGLLGLQAVHSRKLWIFLEATIMSTAQPVSGI